MKEIAEERLSISVVGGFCGDHAVHGGHGKEESENSGGRDEAGTTAVVVTQQETRATKLSVGEKKSSTTII